MFGWVWARIIGFSGIAADVTANRELRVKSNSDQQIPPEGKQRIELQERVIVTGNNTSESAYEITDGKTLELTRFEFGGEEAIDGNRQCIYYAPNGILDGNEVIISNQYKNGDSDFVPLTKEILGDGTAKIILELKRLGGGSAELWGKMVGFEEL